MGEMIASSLLNGAADLIAGLGGDARRVANQVGVPPAALHKADTLVSAYALTDFYESAARETGCRNFGLMMADGLSLAVVGPVWPLLDTAETIGAMVADLVSNFAIYSEAAIIALAMTEDGALMSFEGRAGHSQSEVQMMEFALAISCNEMRRHCTADWNPAMIQFRHAAPVDWALHHRIFGPNLMFEQDRNAIFMDNATLWQERCATPLTLRAKAQQTLKELSVRMRPLAAAQVEGAIRSGGTIAESSIALVSSRMGIAERTLQRRLAADGTSFKQVLETVRADLALKYVEQTALSLGQIAELLGYSELSAFTRAFKRWHGRTAISIRRRGPNLHKQVMRQAAPSR